MTAHVDKRNWKVVPSSILGVVVGTHLAPASFDDEDGEHEDPNLWFGFIPNERGRIVFPEALCRLTDQYNELISLRSNWSVKINHQSGGVDLVADCEDDLPDGLPTAGRYTDAQVRWSRLLSPTQIVFNVINLEDDPLGLLEEIVTKRRDHPPLPLPDHVEADQGPDARLVNRRRTDRVLDRVAITSDPTVLRIVQRLEDEAYQRQFKHSITEDKKERKRHKPVTLSGSRTGSLSDHKIQEDYFTLGRADDPILQIMVSCNNSGCSWVTTSWRSGYQYGSGGTFPTLELAVHDAERRYKVKFPK